MLSESDGVGKEIRKMCVRIVVGMYTDRPALSLTCHIPNKSSLHPMGSVITATHTHSHVIHSTTCFHIHIYAHTHTVHCSHPQPLAHTRTSTNQAHFQTLASSFIHICKYIHTWFHLHATTQTLRHAATRKHPHVPTSAPTTRPISLSQYPAITSLPSTTKLPLPLSHTQPLPPF